MTKTLNSSLEILPSLLVSSLFNSLLTSSSVAKGISKFFLIIFNKIYNSFFSINPLLLISAFLKVLSTIFPIHFSGRVSGYEPYTIFNYATTGGKTS